MSTTDLTMKRPVGRPSKYDPALCEKVIEWGRQGKSRAWIAAEIGVSRECLYEWGRQHPEFSDALGRAKDLEQQWWEDAGQRGMTSGGFNAAIWSRSMAARFPADWSDRPAKNTSGEESSWFADLLARTSRQPLLPVNREIEIGYIDTIAISACGHSDEAENGD